MMSPPARLFLLGVVLLLAACACTSCSSDSHYNTPSLSGDPSDMSSDTLCYRYGGGSSTQNKAIAEEIMARGLDCAAILRSDPLYTPDAGRWR